MIELFITGIQWMLGLLPAGAVRIGVPVAAVLAPPIAVALAVRTYRALHKSKERVVRRHFGSPLTGLSACAGGVLAVALYQREDVAGAVFVVAIAVAGGLAVFHFDELSSGSELAARARKAGEAEALAHGVMDAKERDPWRIAAEARALRASRLAVAGIAAALGALILTFGAQAWGIPHWCAVVAFVVAAFLFVVSAAGRKRTPGALSKLLACVLIATTMPLAAETLLAHLPPSEAEIVWLALWLAVVTVTFLFAVRALITAKR